MGTRQQDLLFLANFEHVDGHGRVQGSAVGHFQRRLESLDFVLGMVQCLHLEIAWSFVVRERRRDTSETA